MLVAVAVFKALPEANWQRDAAPALSQWLAQPPHSMKLVPTARSAIHA